MLREHEIIGYVCAYLILSPNWNRGNSKWEVLSISPHGKRSIIDEIMRAKDVPEETISTIENRKNGEDIIARKKWGRGSRELRIEAKGKAKVRERDADVIAGLNTGIGQFMMSDFHHRSRYFAFAFPWKMRTFFRNNWRKNGEILPQFKILIDRFHTETKRQGLWFLFVNENGFVIRETWLQTLTRRS